MNFVWFFIDLVLLKPKTMTLTELTNDYKDYLFNSFVDNYALWECCLNYTNTSIQDINHRFGASISLISYDEFCKFAIATISHFVKTKDLEKRLLVTTKMVENSYPHVRLLSAEEKGDKIAFYQDIIRKKKIGELEEEIYKACICSVLQQVAPEHYDDYHIIFEIQWSLKSSLCNQQ